MIAPPAVHSITSAGLASTWLDGLLSGNTMGRAVLESMACTVSCRNRPGTPVKPYVPFAVAPAAEITGAAGSEVLPESGPWIGKPYVRVRTSYGRVEVWRKDGERLDLSDLIRIYNATAEVVEPGEARLRFGGSQQARFLCGYDCMGPTAFKGPISEADLLARARHNLRRLSAVGRMALSNYLFDSLLFTTLFYGYGFDLYGALHRPMLYVLVLATWAVQLLVSPLWLDVFRFGPAEWVWRSLTYWKPQPMLRRGGV